MQLGQECFVVYLKFTDDILGLDEHSETMQPVLDRIAYDPVNFGLDIYFQS